MAPPPQMENSIHMTFSIGKSTKTMFANYSDYFVSVWLIIDNNFTDIFEHVLYIKSWTFILIHISYLFVVVVKVTLVSFVKVI